MAVRSLGGRTSREAGRSWPAALARLGLVARGVIYLLIGWLALMLAVGHSAQEPDQEGALQSLAGKPYGSIGLWLLAVGFAGYALWRLWEAVQGPAGARDGTGPRLKSLFRGICYAVLAVTAVSVVHGSGGSQAGKQQEGSARLMHHAGGRWLVGLVGLVVVAVGVTLVVEGLRRKFLDLLRTGEMSRSTRRTVEVLGVVGTVSRGAVFTLAGALVIDAAVAFDPAKAGGIDVALRSLRDQAFGPYLLGLCGVGLLVFGAYGLCEARWHKV